MTLPTFAHPWFLLLFLLLPVLAWLKGKRGQQSAFLYSSVQLVRPVANISQWSPGRVLLALRWLVLAVMIIALARPQLTRSETSVRASGVDIVMAIDLSGSMAADEMADRLSIVLPVDRNYHTAAGFVLSQLGHLPEIGESFDSQGWRFEVVDLDGRRIDKIMTRRIAAGRRRATI